MVECDWCGEEAGLRRHLVENEDGETLVLGYCCSEEVEDYRIGPGVFRDPSKPPIDRQRELGGNDVY